MRPLEALGFSREHGEEWTKRFMKTAGTGHRRQGATYNGKMANKPCKCGSGKKHKKCCGK